LLDLFGAVSSASALGSLAAVALNWNWLAAAGLLPLRGTSAVMMMMFMCMKRGTRSPKQLE